MLKPILSALFICCSFVSFSQDNLFLKTDNIPVKVKLPPAIKEITSSNKYAITIPENLTYHKRTKEIRDFNWLENNLNIEGKRARKLEDADFIFQVSTDGIAIAPTTPTAFSGGYIYNFKCYFPITLKVINKQGAEEKIFKFNSDSIVWTYHANFLLDPFTTEDWNPRKKIVPFVNADSAINNFKRNEAAIYKRIEFNAWYYTMEFAKKVLSLSYNSTKLTPSQYYYKFTNKKGIEANKEITDAIKKQADLIKKLSDEKSYIANVEAIREGQKYFDGIISDISKYSTNVQKMILSSAALSALFGGDHDKAATYFISYYKIEEAKESDLAWSFRSAYNDVRNWNIARSESLEVKPVENIDFLYVNN